MKKWSLAIPMELKSSAAAAAFFFLLFLLSAPRFSRGDDENPEIYAIDYRGPETHSHIPPPNRSGGLPSLHGHRKSKGLRGSQIGANAEETHG